MTALKKRRHSSFYLTLGLITLGKPDAILWGQLHSPMLRAMWYRSQVANSQHHPVSHVSKPPWEQTLGLQSCIKVTAPWQHWQQSHWESWARTVYLHHSQIPDHNIMWENKCWLLLCPYVLEWFLMQLKVSNKGLTMHLVIIICYFVLNDLIAANTGLEQKYHLTEPRPLWQTTKLGAK